METNDNTNTPALPLMDARCISHPIEDRAYTPGKFELDIIKEYLDTHTQKLRELWEREKNPQIACGPYFYAATLTVSSALTVSEQKSKLLKMLHTLLRGKSIAQKYQVIEEESYYVWELTKAKTLHIHLLVKSKLPAKYYDIRKVKGMEGANWQELKSYDAWCNYLNKNLYDEQHIDIKNQYLLADKLPNAAPQIPESKGSSP